MLITEIKNDQILPEEKTIEISIFDRSRGFLYKKEFNLVNKVFIDLNALRIFNAHRLTEYTFLTAFGSDYHNFDFLGKEIEIEKPLRDYINEKNSELNISYENKKILDEISLKEKEISELKSKLKETPKCNDQ